MPWNDKNLSLDIFYSAVYFVTSNDVYMNQWIAACS